MLRQWMFFVRVQTMVKNRIYAITDRHPDIPSQAPAISDLFGASGMAWLNQIVLLGDDDRLLNSELDLLQVLRGKISESNGMVRELAKGDKKVKLLRSIPGLGPYFSVLVAKEIDDISLFRDKKNLRAYAGLVPSTYASGGKVFHGRITKIGNKWLRCAFIEAVHPAIISTPELFAYYQQFRIRKDANATRVATARRLLTIVDRVLSQERLYQRRTKRVRRGVG